MTWFEASTGHPLSWNTAHAGKGELAMPELMEISKQVCAGLPLALWWPAGPPAQCGRYHPSKVAYTTTPHDGPTRRPASCPARRRWARPWLACRS